MGSSVTIKIEGLKQLGENLRALQNEVLANKILRQAGSAGAAVVRDDARKRAAPHRKTGLMEKSIAIRRVRRESRPGHEVYAVGIFKVPGGTYANNKTNRRKGRVGKEYEVSGLAYYWMFLEFGTVKQRKTPFLVPAFKEQKLEAIQAMKDKLGKGIDSAVSKLTKKK